VTTPQRCSDERSSSADADWAPKRTNRGIEEKTFRTKAPPRLRGAADRKVRPSLIKTVSGLNPVELFVEITPTSRR
jgi:hypothetical protein